MLSIELSFFENKIFCNRRDRLDHLFICVGNMFYTCNQLYVYCLHVIQLMCRYHIESPMKQYLIRINKFMKEEKNGGYTGSSTLKACLPFNSYIFRACMCFIRCMNITYYCQSNCLFSKNKILFNRRDRLDHLFICVGNMFYTCNQLYVYCVHIIQLMCRYHIESPMKQYLIRINKFMKEEKNGGYTGSSTLMACLPFNSYIFRACMCFNR